jgi:outer membrane protein W
MASITGVGLTTILSEVEVAGEPVKHGVAFEVNTHVTASLFANAVEVNVAAFVPALVPLTFHWYEGVVPPFVGVAVNVTEVPEQIVVAVAAIDTLAVRIGLTVTVLVAVAFEHPPVPVTV